MVKGIISKINGFSINKWLLPLLFLCLGIVASIPYYIEELFILSFASLFLLFYLFIKQKRAYNFVFMPFFMFFIGFYTPIYLFLSELYPYKNFGFSENQAIFIVICSCVLIPLLHASVSALIMLITRLFPDEKYYPFGFASLWVILEWVLSLGTLAFPWTSVSVSLVGFLPYLQTASLFGNSFITFITVLSCCYFSLGLIEPKRSFAIIGVVVIAFNSILGTVLFYLPTNSSDTVKTAVIQGNVLSNEKWTSSNRDEIYTRYISLTEEAAQNGSKLIVLPESAIPLVFYEDGYLHKNIAYITQKYNTTVVMGVIYRNDGEQYNSVIAILPDGSISDRYDKRHLVPFGEFIPFVDTLGDIVPFVAELSADSGTYVEGDQPTVIKTDYGAIGALVCFDSIFGEFSADAVENGAELFAVVTNDSWFNDSIGIYNHLRHSQIRAIENGRYVARAANTGISAFIDDKGRIINSTAPLTVDVIYSDISTTNEKTAYSFTRNFILYSSFACITILVLIKIRRALQCK